jgi:uncharacterized membrane protein
MPRQSHGAAHVMFTIALWAKVVFAVGETIGGIAMLFVPKDVLVRAAVALTHKELARNPHEIVARHLVTAANHVSTGGKLFAAIYLLAHGALKLWLVIGLLRGKLWYYPVALAVFFGFIAYQLYRYAVEPSAMLLAITALDVVVVALTWHEWRSRRYRYQKRLITRGSNSRSVYARSDGDASPRDVPVVTAGAPAGTRAGGDDSFSTRGLRGAGT